MRSLIGSLHHNLTPSSFQYLLSLSPAVRSAHGHKVSNRVVQLGFSAALNNIHIRNQESYKIKNIVPLNSSKASFNSRGEQILTSSTRCSHSGLGSTLSTGISNSNRVINLLDSHLYSKMMPLHKLFTRWKGLNTLHYSTSLGFASSLFTGRRCLHCGVNAGLFSDWCEGDPYRDPSTELQAILLTSLYAPSDVVCCPSVDEMTRADDIFKQHHKMERTLRVVDNLPPSSGSEVCFIGRSNVGKSSLIKSLFFDCLKLKIIASKTPGRTRTLNFYTVDKRLSLVDMPGYGYNMPEHYVNSVENYIKKRNNLVRTFLLIDSVAGLTTADRLGSEMLQEFGKPYVIVMTKIDKTSHHRVLRNLLDISKYRVQHMPGALPQIFLVSSHKRAGLSILRAFIVDICGLNNILLEQGTSAV